MKSTLRSLCLSLFITASAHAEPIQFTSAQHKVVATVPDGWDQVQGVRSNTALKIARGGSGAQMARIAVVLDVIPAGHIPDGFDVWSLPDEDIRKGAESTSLAGEAVTVLNVGRAAIDGVHVVWSKTRRKAPNGSDVLEFVYEGVRGSQYLTIRLTSFGDGEWFAQNQAIFAEFVRSIRLK